MNAYEEEVIRGWLYADRQPLSLSRRLTKGLTGRVRRILQSVEGSPESMAGTLLTRIRSVAREGIIQTLERSATASQYARVEQSLRQAGSSAATPQAIRMLPLQVKDTVAKELIRVNTRTVAIEGVLAGLCASLCECVPGLQSLTIPTILADIAASIYLLAQNAVRIGYSYGYSLDHVEDIPHFLTSMSPYTADAALCEGKWMAHAAVRQGGERIASAFAQQVALRTIVSDNPAFSSLLDSIATRLALRLGEREWGLLIPVAGAVLQGSVNAAFAKSGSAQSIRYFQELHLLDRYGEDYVQARREAMTKAKIG